MGNDGSTPSNTPSEDGKQLRQGSKSKVQRQLRQESNFGCAVCGVPVIEYHHIIPESEVEHYDPNHMIALCPTHHRPSDDEAISRDRLYDYKEDPHITELVDHVFYFDPDNPKISLGTSSVELLDGDEDTLLNINGQDIINVSFEDGLLHFDILFYSKDDELIAQITDNEWWAKVNDVWDLQSKSHWFRLYNSDEEIGVKIEHDKKTGRINLEGKFRYGGHRLNIFPSSIQNPDGGRVGTLMMSDIRMPPNSIFIYSGESDVAKEMDRFILMGI